MSVEGKTDELVQFPKPDYIPPADISERRFDLRRISMTTGQQMTLQYQVLPEAFVIANQGAGDVLVQLAADVITNNLKVTAGRWVRLPGITHFVTVYALADTTVIVIGESGGRLFDAGTF